MYGHARFPTQTKFNYASKQLKVLPGSYKIEAMVYATNRYYGEFSQNGVATFEKVRYEEYEKILTQISFSVTAGNEYAVMNKFTDLGPVTPSDYEMVGKKGIIARSISNSGPVKFNYETSVSGVDAYAKDIFSSIPNE